MSDTLTTTTSAVFIPELWINPVIKATESRLVLADKVMRLDAEAKKYGDILHLPNVSNLTANDKTQGSEVTLNQVTETDNSVTIDTWKECSFEIEDIVKTQSKYDLRSLYTQKAGYALAKAIDTSLASLYSSLTTTDVGDYGVDIDDATVLAAIQTLHENDADEEDRCFVIKPSQMIAIMKLDKFVKADSRGDMGNFSPVVAGVKKPGYWGDIYGDPVYYTNQVQTTAGTPTQTHNLYFHKEAFALALQLAPRVQGQNWLKDLAFLVVMDTLYGVNVIRADHGVELRS